MTQVYFLIPGLILPASAKALLSEEALKAAALLTESVTGDVLRQTLVTGPESGSVHLAWAWKVITRRALPFSTAPFSWLIDDGPDLTCEIWSLTFGSRTASGSIKKASLNDDCVDTLSNILYKPLQQAGFTLQRWDTVFYLTRKTGWGVIAPEWPLIEAGLHRPNSLIMAPNSSVTALNQAIADLDTLTTYLRQAQLHDTQGNYLDTLAITGGGCQQRFFPPTLLRSVLSDDPAIRSWAQESGILNHRTAKASGTVSWPTDAPAGECLAVISELYEPWLYQDWALWSSKLPNVVHQIRSLAQAAASKGCDSALLVGCSTQQTVSIAIKIPRTHSGAISLLERFQRKRKLSPEAWLFEELS